MANEVWLKQLIRSKIFWRAFECTIWITLSIHEWRGHPNGLYSWMCLVLVALSAFILGTYVIERKRKSRQRISNQLDCV
jgi:hypothetical protein